MARIVVKGVGVKLLSRAFSVSCCSPGRVSRRDRHPRETTGIWHAAEPLTKQDRLVQRRPDRANSRCANRARALATGVPYSSRPESIW